MEINDFGLRRFNEKKNKFQGLKTIFSSLEKLAFANKLFSIMIGTAVVMVIGGGIFAFISSQGNQPSQPSLTPSPVESPSPTDNVESSPIDTSTTSVDVSTPSPSPIPSPSPSPTPSPTTSNVPDHDHSNLYADPPSVLADGSTSSKITITVKDASGNLISEAAVDLTTSDTQATFKAYSAGSEVTDASGNAVFTMTSKNIGTDNVDVSVTINGTTTTLTDLGQVTFTTP